MSGFTFSYIETQYITEGLALLHVGMWNIVILVTIASIVIKVDG